MFGRCLFIGAPATSMINVNICGIDPLPLLAMTGIVLGIIGENDISVVKAVEGGFCFSGGFFCWYVVQVNVAPVTHVILI